MKVIHLVSGGDSGGAKTHIHSLLHGLNRTIQADMICFADGPFVQQAQALGIPAEVISGRNPLTVLGQLKRRITAGSYDIIHCHGSRGNLMGALMGRITGLPVVTTVHSDPKLDYMGRPFAQLIFGTLNACALRMIPYHIGVSNAMTDILIERGIVRRNFFSIYNGITFDDPPCHERRLEYLRNLGAQVDDDSVVIGIAARLNPVKDIATLIRGFAAAYGQCPLLRLVIAGDGEEEVRLKALARESGVEAQVTFAGWIGGGMDRFYSALDINALSSLSETFPYALTEGARFRLASVAAKVGGIPDLIENGVNGFLFTPGDWQQLGKYLATLGNDADLRRSMGQRLYEKASARFSLDKTVETQLDIYSRISADRATADRRSGVVLCGAYGQGNAGDHAILQAIISGLRSIDGRMPICVMTRTPRQARKAYRVEAVHSFNYPAWRRRMAGSRLYINGGGSLIQNVTSRRSLWFYLSTLKIARRMGCRVMMYGCGIGPVRHRFDRTRTARIINGSVDAITLREPLSGDELMKLGVTEPCVVLAADPAVSLPSAKEDCTAILEAAGLAPGSRQRYLGIAVRPWPGFARKAAVIAAAAEYAYDTYGLIPVFIPLSTRLDTDAAARVAAHLKHTPHALLPGCSRPEQTMALFSQMDVVLSMRLHGLIFAAVSGVPQVGIVYDPKVSSFLEFMGQSLYTSFDELTLERLKHQLDAAVNADRRGSLKQRARWLRSMERNNLLLARKLLNSLPR